VQLFSGQPLHWAGYPAKVQLFLRKLAFYNFTGKNNCIFAFGGVSQVEAS
jgi:hypothetical protein